MARIGIDARLTYYTQGGIAQYTQHLIRALATLDAPHDLVILHSRKDQRTLSAGRRQRRVSCWTPAHHRFERLALALELAPLRLDLLHSPDFIPPLGGRFRSVITVHDLAFLHYPQFLTTESRRYYNDQIAAAVARADAVIAVSQATCSDLISLLGVPAEKVTVIPEAAGEQFRPVPEEEIARLRAAHGLPGNYILFVGTIEPRKNVGGLLRAYARLRADLPDAPPLVIAGGSGWLYDEVFALYEELRLGQAVLWYGPVDPEDLPALYSGARVFCLPSFYEGFGLPPLEAMACGTPVVVSNRASLPEVVGDAALLVDPNDVESISAALRHVLTDARLAAELRERGLARAALFNWEQTARQTLALYEQTLEKQ
jgi:glycosyltransferase involved in cell wall biosynthesis